MTKNFKNIFLVTLLLSICSILQAAEVISKQSGTDPFNGIITEPTKAFDRYTGTMYIGTYTTGAGSTADGTYCVAMAKRDDTNFSPLATNVLVNDEAILGISLLNAEGKEATHVACLTKTLSGEVIAIDINTPAIANQSGTLLDAAGALTSGISLITSNTTHIFARVLGTDGIALVSLNKTTGALTQNDDATQLDITTDEIKINSDLTSLIVNDMHWNTSLETLYVACTSQTGTTDTDGAYALVKGKIGSDGKLTLEKIYNNGTPNPNLNSIFTTTKTADTSQNTVRIYKVRHMETSTGQQYLILNGGYIGPDTAPDNAGNKIFALRIAKTSGTGFLQGDIIKNDTFAETALAANDFQTLALLDSAIVGSADLPWLQANGKCTDMVVVGDAVYASAAPTGGRTELQNPGVWKSQAMFTNEGLICGWTKWERVYPSLGQSPVTIDNTAAFDVDALNGKIWQVRDDLKTTMNRTAWRENNTATSLGKRISDHLADGCFCVLDLPGAQPFESGETTDITEISLYVPGIGGSLSVEANIETFNSFALFGGYEKVVFARTAQTSASGNTYPEVTTAYGTELQEDDYLFTNASNGLSGAGAIRCLGYSYNNEGDSNSNNPGYGYFFAGTDKGLYIYARENQNGFNGNYGLVDLNATPLFNNTANAQWWKFENNKTREHSISHIVSTTNRKVYCVGLDLNTSEGLTDRLFEITLDTALNNMQNDNHVAVRAESGKGGLPEHALFTGFTAITNKSRDAAFGVLSTNDGVWTTTCPLEQLALADGEWVQIDTTAGQPFNSIYSLKDVREVYDATKTSSLSARTFFATAHTDDSRGLNIYQNSTIMQGGSAIENENDSDITTATPEDVTTPVASRTYALNKDTTNLKYLNFMTKFWTDGGRRLFTTFDPNEDNQWNNLKSLPFNGPEWNQTTEAYSLMSDATLAKYQRIYWIENISGTGQIFAGTDKGVITLD